MRILSDFGGLIARKDLKVNVFRKKSLTVESVTFMFWVSML